MKKPAVTASFVVIGYDLEINCAVTALCFDEEICSKPLEAVKLMYCSKHSFVYIDGNVALVSLKEQIDTATPTGRFLVSIFAALAQLEREQILIRQQEGVNAQKAAGTYTGGRPRVQVNKKLFDTVIARWRTGEISAVQAMKELSMKKSTFYRLIKQ